VLNFSGDEAKVLWDRRDYQELGHLVANARGPGELAHTLAKCVDLLVREGAPLALQDAFASVVRDEAQWPFTCGVFDALRKETLRLEREGLGESPEYSCLMFQENTAKHLCNVSQNLRRFDASSGGWAIASLAHFVDQQPAERALALQARALEMLVE
jgi:hypothetical protein